MARIPIDFAGVDPVDDYPTFDVGEYILEVTKAAQKTATSSGNLKLQVTFKIHAGPNGSPANAGKFITDSYSFTEQSRGFLLRFLNACGISREMASQLDDQQLIGRMIVGQVTKDEWPLNSGQYRNRIGREKAYGAAGVIPGTIPDNGAPATAPAPMLLNQVPGAVPAQQVPGTPPQQWPSQQAPITSPQQQFVAPQQGQQYLPPQVPQQQQQYAPPQAPAVPVAPPVPVAPAPPVAAPQMVPQQQYAPQVPMVPQVPAAPPMPMAPQAPPKPPG